MLDNNKRINLVDRQICILCGGHEFETVWSSEFDNSDIQRNLKKFCYNADAACLAGKKFELVCCQSCNMLFHKKILDEESIKALYSSWIDENQINKFEESVFLRNEGERKFEKAKSYVKSVLSIYDSLKNIQDSSVNLLDYGCGDAGILRIASEFGFECYGIDFSVTRKDRALNSGVSIFTNIDEFLENYKKPLHVATLFTVLEHLTHPRDDISKLEKLMVPGGLLVIEVPDCSGISIPRNFEEFHCVQPLEHINCFTPSTLKLFIESAGFEYVKRPAAHVSTNIKSVIRTELGRIWRPASTSMYFRKCLQ